MPQFQIGEHRPHSRLDYGPLRHGQEGHPLLAQRLAREDIRSPEGGGKAHQAGRQEGGG